MAEKIEFIQNSTDLRNELDKMRQDKFHQALVCELGGGALRFALSIFPNQDIDKIYAKKEVRSSEGKGAHFDVYGKLIDSDYPWIGVYNLSGSVGIKTLPLPEDLAEAYESRFSKIKESDDEAAYQARRDFSSIAISQPGALIAEAAMKTGTGLILPQHQGRHVVHDITPSNSFNSGSYLKLLNPKKSNPTTKVIKAAGFKPIDELLSEGIGQAKTNAVEPIIDIPAFEVEKDKKSRPSTRRHRTPRSNTPQRYD